MPSFPLTPGGPAGPLGPGIPGSPHSPKNTARLEFAYHEKLASMVLVCLALRADHLSLAHQAFLPFRLFLKKYKDNIRTALVQTSFNAIQMLPARPGIPSTPSLPGSPILPTSPIQFSDIPGIPGAPGIPGLPFSPFLPGIPGLPGNPRLQHPFKNVKVIANYRNIISAQN
ncbi:hypothetical protein T01_12436 [Trichinella spiralis]|uniref:Accumulation-associated protein n=1 Tax=Trichinella spiralis TaxID=6334 RepID=A0A0V1BDZ2_TRISP|nr:hypothetical protein T01_12436 [Trichinella spiralis]